MGNLKIDTTAEELEAMYGPNCMSVSEISEHYGVSVKYIDHIFRYLGVDRKYLKMKYPRVKEKIKLPMKQVTHMYSDIKMSSKEIAKHFNCEATVVIRRLRKHGVSIRHHNDTKRGSKSHNRIKVDDGLIISKYLMDGQSQRSVAESLGIKVGVVSRVLNENGVKRKPIGECRDFWGENAPNWNPSLTEEDRINRRDIRQQAIWRDKVYRKDEYKCQKCGLSGNLNAHHILGHAEHVDVRWDVENGATLCKPCHVGFHSRYGIKGFDADDLEEYLGEDDGE